MVVCRKVPAQAHISKFCLYNIIRVKCRHKVELNILSVFPVKRFGKEIMKISLIFIKILEKDAGRP